MLLKLGEIVLKGRNRQQFERILHNNIRAALRETGVPVDMRQREGVIMLRVADGERRGPAGWAQAAARIAERMRDVPGIVTVAQPLRVAKTPEAVVAAAVDADRGQAGPVRRAGPPQGQALPADLSRAGRAGRPQGPAGARPGGEPP